MSSRLVQVLLQQLMKGESERFTLREGAETLLALALDQELDQPDPMASVRSLLAHAAAFEGRLASPSVAVALRAVLRNDPRAMRMLKTRVLDESRIDRMRSFVKSEGREIVLKAPMFGAAQRGGGQS